MRILQSVLLIGGISCSIARAQLYVLKDHRPDTTEDFFFLYDSVPQLVDSFFVELKFEDLASIKKFVPKMKYLKATFDTLAIDYKLDQVVVRQQVFLKNLQKQYRKIIKHAEKNRLRLKQLVRGETNYNFGKDEKGNEFCYVAVICFKRKKKYELKYVAIRLNGKWFLGDELTFEHVE